MKKITGLLIFALYMVFILFLQKKSQNMFFALSAVMGSLFLFSSIVRNRISFKPWFTSRYNIFTSKVRQQKDFDITKDVLFDKIIEVLTLAGFTMQHANKQAGTLFATSKMTMYSWGENLYLDLTEHNGITKVDFCSACFFGVTSWGRNEKNYDDLLETFEKSLII